MQTKSKVEVDENAKLTIEKLEGRPFGRYNLLKAHFARPSMTDQHPILEIRQLIIQQISRDIKIISDESELDACHPIDINGRDVSACTVSASIELIKRSFTGQDPDDQTEQLQLSIRRKARIRQLGQRLVLRFDEPIRIDIFSLLNASRRDIWNAQHDGRLRSIGVLLPNGVHANLTFTINIRSAVLSVVSAAYDADNANESICIEAAWERLPRCPNLSQLLDVSAPPIRRKVFGKQLGVALSMAWTDANSINTSKQSSDRFQLSAPETSESLDGLAPRYRLTFLVHSSYIKRSIQNDLTCPFCADGKHYKNFNSLQLHLVVGHKRFHFQVEDDHSAHRLFTVSKIIHMSLREAPPPPPQTAVRNKEPDFSANTSSIVHDIEPQQTKRGRGRPRKIPRLQYEARKPRDVPDIPERILEIHIVPLVKDSHGNEINFYRTGSKRPLEVGEEVVDSDNEIDDDWLKHKQLEHLRKFRYKNERGVAAKLSEGEIEFMADFNGYIDYEEQLGSSGDVLKRDAIVRFARKSRHKFGKIDWFRQFEAKLKRLQMHAIIDDETIVYCLAKTEPVHEPSNVEAINGAVDSPRSQRQQTNGVPKAIHQDSDVEAQNNGASEGHVIESSGNDLSESEGVSANINQQVVDSDSDDAPDEQAIISDDSIDRNRTDPGVPHTMAGAQQAQDEDSQPENEKTNGNTSLSSVQSRFTNGGTDHGNNDMRKRGSHGMNRYNLDGASETAATTRDMCICGKRVYGLKKVVFCGSPHCKRERFQMECVGAKDDKQPWRCSDCRSSSEMRC